MPFHQNRKVTLAALFLILAILLPTACQSSNPATTTPSVTQAPTQNAAYAGKRILFVNSYHVGYAWSDGIETGIHNVLDNTGIELRFVRLDTKNHADEDFRQQAGKAAKAEFDAFKPDVVIVSDDNAVRYFIVPYFQASNTPIVFTAINWDTSAYNFDKMPITGLVEVDPIDQMVSDLSSYLKGSRVGYITIDNESERKNAEAYRQRFFKGDMKSYMVKSYAEFKDAYLKAQAENDLVIIGNNAGSSDTWDGDKDATAFFTKNAKVPTGTINAWMTPYTLLTVAKVPAELGEWSAQAALRILDGTPVSSIPTAENKKAKLSVNLDIAKQLNIVFSPSILRNADIYPPTSGK
jgi:ABC transporter substrate binding protein